MLRDFKKPFYCFTGDVDWAPESMIEEFIRFFKDEGVPLTPFVTHKSDAVKKEYRKLRKHVGVHPNFMINTTHGENISEIVRNSIKFWPEARCFRSHYYVDSLLITQKYFKEGFKYDSNICLFLQPDIFPLNLVTGLLRFPVFFEDILYIDRKTLSEKTFKNKSLSSGLKIFNFHPVHFCLNTPSVKHYEKRKDEIYGNKNWNPFVYDGFGIRNILEEIIDLMKDYRIKVFYLDDLYKKFKPYYETGGLSSFFFREKNIDKPKTNVSVWSEPSLLSKYNTANREGRSNIIRNVYNDMDGRNLYVTSPDFNLRELENKFIIDNIKTHFFDDLFPKIIDVGCGNGLTSLRLAQSISADITGVDFSQSMVEGANYLKKNFKGLKCFPRFEIGDARKLEYPDNHFDAAITQRLILNLPDEETQKSVIKEIHRILKKNGFFIMVEGTRNGLRRLNAFRLKMGLDLIPDKSKTNVSSLKFEEEDIESFLKHYFEIIGKQHFGLYYLISRVVHPLLVAPKSPRYDAEINAVARKVAEKYPDYNQMSHIVGYVLKAVK